MITWIENHYFRISEIISAGGVVMVPLLAISVLMWLLIVDRVLFFRRLYRNNMKAGIALKHVREASLPDPAIYRGVVSLLINDFLRQCTGNSELDRHMLDASVTQINRRLTDYLALIGVLAAVAPLMGLLGTVTGMITTFDVLAVFGTGNAKAMAGGISEALITTQTGLIIAIPGLYMKSFLDRRSNNLQQRIRAVGLYLRRHL